MPEKARSIPGPYELNERDISSYREAVHAGRYVLEDIAAATQLTLEEVTRAGHNLRLLRLLRPMPGEPDVLAPVSPDAAVVDLVGPSEQQIRELQQSVSEARSSLLALLPAYFESRKRRNSVEAFDLIRDISVLESMLEDCGTRCRNEILTVQPGGPRPHNLLEDARRRTLERLGRGLQVKHIYQHTVRGDLTTTAYIRDVTAAGAEVRTTDQVIDRMVIYDREIVFLPEQGVVDREPGAIVVREPTLVAFLCRLYDHLWAKATTYEPDADDTTDVSDDVKRAIIKLMSEGHKDELVARRMGMSVRTCRRHFSKIMDELGSTSRFQAGVICALSGILDEDVAHTSPSASAGSRTTTDSPATTSGIQTAPQP